MASTLKNHLTPSHEENEIELLENKSSSNLSFENDQPNELKDYLPTGQKKEKTEFANLTKKTLLKSKHVIESTLKETIDDFERKLEKIEAELDSGFSKNRKGMSSVAETKNENSMCQRLDEKIERLHKKMKHAKEGNCTVLQNIVINGNGNENEKREKSIEVKTVDKNTLNILSKNEFPPEKNEHFSLKDEIKNLNLSLKNTLESLKEVKPIVPEKFHKKEEKIVPEEKELLTLEILEKQVLKENDQKKPPKEEDQTKNKHLKPNKSKIFEKKEGKEDHPDQKKTKKGENFIDFKEEFKIL